MKKSILFIAALIIISSDFIAQGSAQDQERQKTSQSQATDTKSESKKNNRKDSTKMKSKKNNEEARKMDNYKNNEPAGSSNAEQQHMDTTINNHR